MGKRIPPDRWMLMLEQVPDSVRNLPRRERYVVLAYYYEGIPARKIAAKMQTTRNNIYVMLCRARKRLSSKIPTP